MNNITSHTEKNNVVAIRMPHKSNSSRSDAIHATRTQVAVARLTA